MFKFRAVMLTGMYLSCGDGWSGSCWCKLAEWKSGWCMSCECKFLQRRLTWRWLTERRSYVVQTCREQIWLIHALWMQIFAMQAYVAIRCLKTLKSVHVATFYTGCSLSLLSSRGHQIWRLECSTVDKQLVQFLSCFWWLCTSSFQSWPL